MRFVFLILALLTQSAPAQTLESGVYVSQDGGSWSRLEIQVAKKNKAQDFRISTMGQNGHTCEVSGELLNRVARNKREADEPTCQSKISITDAGLEFPSLFTAKGDSCHSYFCGVRADYDGIYKKVPSQCLKLDDKRELFKLQYKSKNFRDAHATLTPLVERCTEYIFWVEATEWINDLAITRFHLGDLKGCRAVLEPLKENYILAIENQRGSPGITEEEWFNRISTAARFNWQKCGGKLPLSKFKAQ